MARFFSVLYADSVVIIGGQTGASACDYGGTQNTAPYVALISDSGHRPTQRKPHSYSNAFLWYK